MMIQPAAKPLLGEITIPGDKSISHRALILGAIADGTTEIKGFLSGEDCLSTIGCLENLGVKIERNGTDAMVYGVGMHGLKRPEKVLDAGNSGTTTRLLTGILAAQTFDSTITGDKSLQSRPMGRIIRPLELMGGQVIGKNESFCPLKIKGQKLIGIEYTLPVASAQLKSALLLAGLYADGTTTVIEPEASRNHTELMLQRFGAVVTCEQNRVSVSKTEALHGSKINVPGDISSAAFFIVAAAVIPGSSVRILNVGLNPTRCGILDALRQMGADIQTENVTDDSEPSGDIIVRYAPLKGITIQGDIIPRMIDEIPVFCVAAAFAKGKTEIRNASELKVKESNRIDMVVNEFSKAGINVKGTEDGLVIIGGKDVTGTIFTPHHDHRMAMAVAVLALRAKTPSQIIDAKCADVSFPGFYDILKSL